MSQSYENQKYDPWADERPLRHRRKRRDQEAPNVPNEVTFPPQPPPASDLEPQPDWRPKPGLSNSHIRPPASQSVNNMPRPSQEHVRDPWADEQPLRHRRRRPNQEAPNAHDKVTLSPQPPPASDLEPQPDWRLHAGPSTSLIQPAAKQPATKAAAQQSRFYLDPLSAGDPSGADYARYQHSTFPPQGSLSSPLIPEPEPGLPLDRHRSSHQSAHSFGSPLWLPNQVPIPGDIPDHLQSYLQLTGQHQSSPALNWHLGSDSFGVTDTGPSSQYHQYPYSTISQQYSALDPGQSVAVRTVPLPQTPVNHTHETTQIEQSRINEPFRQRPHYIDSLTTFDANAGSSYFLDRSENGSPPSSPSIPP